MTVQESREVLEPIRDELARKRRDLAEYERFAEQEAERVSREMLATWSAEVEARWKPRGSR